jgi:putative addiction module component (TIGR02574 family)
MSTVVKQALSLSVEDRLELIEELWDSLVATPEAIPVSNAQRKELARRRRAPARNPSAAQYEPSSHAEGKTPSSHPGGGA